MPQAIQQAVQFHQEGRLSEAERLYREALRTSPQDYDLLHLYGVLKLQQGKPDEALGLLSKAIAIRPKALEALGNLSAVLLMLNRNAEALAQCERILAINRSDLGGLYNRGMALGQLGRGAEALASFNQVLAIKPDHVDALFNSATLLAAMERNEESLAIYNRTIALAPQHADALNNRGNLLVRLGRNAEAVASYHQALALKPDHVNALSNRGNALRMLRRYDEALATFERALAVAPDHVDALNNRGNVLLDLDRPIEALASYDRALAVKPDDADLLTNRGNALRKLQRYDEALASFERALAVAPVQVDALNHRGNALIELHRPIEALASFDSALAVKPDNADVLTNRAFALHQLDRYLEALQSSEEALAIDPDLANAFFIRGHALTKLQRYDEAVLSYDRVMTLEPDHRYAFGESVMNRLAACSWEGNEGLVRTLEEHLDSGKSIIQPFSLLGLPIKPSDRLQCARDFVRDGMPLKLKPLPPRPIRPSGKIRLAYLSGDFRRHPVSQLLVELIEKHDRTRFDVLGVSLGGDDGSVERIRIAKAFDQFHEMHRRSTEDIAALLNELGLDIVVDLAGHTQGGRLLSLAYRPAPIAVNFLGYPGTTGADFIDYIIGDPVILPLDQQPYYSETIVQLPDCYLPNDRTKTIAAETPTRAAAGLPDEGFVFCCFNNSYKISAAMFDVWMRLLGAIEGSVLWLSEMNASATANLRAAAGARGIDPKRLVFAPRVPLLADHLARHRLADLFVDTCPYNAHTTASDALWAGLPVLTCQGESFPGRVAASQLHAVGLPELVTSDVESYEMLALKLARDPALLQSIRQKLARNRLTYPLFDTERFRRHIEAAYTTMWETHQRGESPRSFRVEPIAG